jgi:signal transduction histidine kinase
LCLPITRRLVEAHGGSIWIEDQPGGGTRVVFTVKAGQAHVSA